MVRQKARFYSWLVVLTLGLLAPPLHAQAPADSVPVKTYTGYFNDTAVYFTAFETNSANFALANNIIYAPRLSLVNGAGLPEMIFFMNGSGLQSVVLSTQPGRPDYGPIWRVLQAWWLGPEPMPLITSFDAARNWSGQGRLAVERTDILFNGPVILVNRPLNLQGIGTLAPTLSPNEFLGIDPAIRTAYFKAHQGYYNGRLVTFLALEHDSGQVHHTPGAIPVPTIGTGVLGHAGIADFYEIEGQPPVIDSIPVPLQTVVPGTGTTPPSTVYSDGQAGVSQETGAAPLYSPLWHVHRVTFTSASRPPLRSVLEIQQAASAGLVTATAGRPEDTFNCPVPFYYTSGTANPTPVYTPGAGGTPITPPAGTTPGTTTPSPGGTSPGGIY